MGKTMRAIGLMSGTSMDGIDVALIETDGEDALERGPVATFPYRPSVPRPAAGLPSTRLHASSDRDERPGVLADGRAAADRAATPTPSRSWPTD